MFENETFVSEQLLDYHWTPVNLTTWPVTTSALISTAQNDSIIFSDDKFNSLFSDAQTYDEDHDVKFHCNSTANSYQRTWLLLHSLLCVVYSNNFQSGITIATTTAVSDDTIGNSDTANNSFYLPARAAARRRQNNRTGIDRDYAAKLTINFFDSSNDIILSFPLAWPDGFCSSSKISTETSFSVRQSISIVLASRSSTTSSSSYSVLRSCLLPIPPATAAFSTNNSSSSGGNELLPTTCEKMQNFIYSSVALLVAVNFQKNDTSALTVNITISTPTDEQHQQQILILQSDDFYSFEIDENDNITNSSCILQNEILLRLSYDSKNASIITAASLTRIFNKFPAASNNTIINNIPIVLNIQIADDQYDSEINSEPNFYCVYPFGIRTCFREMFYVFELANSMRYDDGDDERQHRALWSFHTDYFTVMGCTLALAIAIVFVLNYNPK